MQQTGLVEVGVAFLALLTFALVVFVAFLIWRDGYKKGWRRSRSSDPTCLTCGYNLSGLTHGRCPECGREHRLEELWKTHLLKPSRGAEAGEAAGRAKDLSSPSPVAEKDRR